MKSLVVSIHDVSPLTQAICHQILEELARLGVTQTSLLVIPIYHNQTPVTRDLGFQKWLAAKVQSGHEAVLHGYYHQRTKQPTDSPLSRWTTEFYTAGEGEFFDLSFEEAAGRLRCGLADLSFLPQEIEGFIAPAWLLGEEAERAVRQASFRYTTRIGSVIGLKNEGEIVSRSLVWSTRASWRVAASLAWNRGLGWTLKDAPLIRVGIHPPDYEHPTVWRQICELIHLFCRQRSATSYRELMSRM